MNLLLLFCNAHFANILKIKSNAKKYMHKKCQITLSCIDVLGFVLLKIRKSNQNRVHYLYIISDFMEKGKRQR